MLQVPSTDGQTVALHDLGDGDRPTLLCHATGLNAGVWGPLAGSLGDGFRRWALDFRAHGASPLAEGATLQWTSMRDDVLAVVDHLAVAPGTLLGIGHSMGGAALALAEQARPGTFAGLWLFEPVIAPPGLLTEGPGGSNPLADGAERRRASFPSFEAAFANYAGKPPFNTSRADALLGYVRHGFRAGDDGEVHLTCRPEHEAAVFRFSGGHNAFDELARVTCPVVVAKGTDSFGVALFADQVGAALPHGRVEAHEFMGHFGPLEAPGRLAASIQAFAAGL
jgi:pimeloyl-ACP methyl ester carboxylesterase